MKKVLLIPYSHQLGSAHTLFEIGRILSENNYQVSFAGEGYYLRFAHEAGFQVHDLIEIPIDRYRKCTDKSNLDYLSNEEIRKFVSEEKKLYKKINPDLVIDTLRPTNYISTKLMDIPRISLIYAVLTKYYKEVLNVPESHFLYATRFFPPLRKFLDSRTSDIRNIFYKLYAKKYRNYMAELGMDNNVDYADLITGDRTFIYDLKEFYPLEDAPSTYKYIGAILYELPSKKPIWLDEVTKRKKEEGLRVVYLSMGSTGKLYPKILQDLIEYSNEVQEILVVGNTCRHEVGKQLEEEENVYLTDFAPADYLMPISDLVITHGGKGTVYHALKNGVPLLGIPHQSEQEWNVRRFKKLGLGELVSKENYNLTDFKDGINKIFSNLEMYKKNCTEYENIIKNFNYEEIILNEVKEILSE